MPSTYNENITCTPSAYLPAANYQVSVTFPGLGVGWLNPSSGGSLSVPLQVSAISPSSGGLGGGLAVTLTGSGFSLTPSDNSITFGSIPCTVLSVTTSQVGNGFGQRYTGT